jgi:hypothetical protein
MTIRTNALTELLGIFPDDAIVRGSEGSLSVMNADGSGEVVLLNDCFHIPDMAEAKRRDTAPSDSTTSRTALETTPPS